MIQQQFTLPLKRNFILSLFLIIENCLILFALPWIFHSIETLIILLVIDIICIRVTNLHWHVTHEAVHGLLMKPRWLNELFGTLLGALFFSSFSIARFGHLNHHRNNRYADTQEVYYDAKKPNTFNYYFEILGGFFIVYEFLLVFLAWAPANVTRKIITYNIKRKEGQHDQAIYTDLKKLTDNPRTIKKVRCESLLLTLALICSVFSYASVWAVWLGYFFVRAFFVSYLNNMPHYRNSIQKNINASDNAYLPKWLALCYLNFNYHRQHHCYPKAPWTALPQLFIEMNDKFDGHYFKTYAKQLKGPVYYLDIVEQQKYSC